MSRPSFLIFFLTTGVLLGLINRHAFVWITRAFAPSRSVRRWIFGVLVSSLAAMVLGRMIDWVWSAAPVGWLLAASGTVQLAVLMGVALLLPFDAVRLVAWAVSRVRARWAAAPLRAAEPAETATQPDAVPRRAFLTQAAAGSAFLIGGSSSFYGALVERHDYRLEELPMPIPGLSPKLDGFTIVQLSDVHIGHFVGWPELRAAEEFIRRAKPDLLVLTGDLLDHDPALADQLGQFARRLVPLAGEGVVAISGNHDFYAGIGPVVHALETAGVTVLRNRGRVIGSADAGFALLGVDDLWARRQGGGPDLSRAVSTLPELAGSIARARDLPRILLCHNPSYFEEAAGQVALQLSGHTHGGQVSLGINPAEWFVKRGWVKGNYEFNGSRLYVNRGFGTVGAPARVGSPPEITRIVLTADTTVRRNTLVSP
jgi:predicted MPP superfamily phosphohydrolase